VAKITLGILVMLVLLTSISGVLAAAPAIRITNVEANPSRVRPGESVRVRIFIEWSDFDRDYRVAANIFDMDEKKFLFEKDPISDSIGKGSGTKTYSIQLTAGRLEKVWKLKAIVGIWEFQQKEEWTIIGMEFQVTIFTKVTLIIETEPALRDLEIKIDGTPTKTGPDGRLRKDDLSATEAHKIVVPAEFELVKGSRAVFIEWSDGSTLTSRDVPAPDKDVTLAVRYKIQHYLTVKSDHGSPKGEGWYDDKTNVTFSVDSSAAVEGPLGSLGVKYVFDRWTGNSSATTAEATIVMDGPKSVIATWKIDYTALYLIVAAVVVVIAVIVTLLIIARRRVRKPVPVYPPPIAPGPGVPTPPPPGPQPSFKYCINCGSQIPIAAKFCLKCGAKQTD
jgi:hypothetical protein